MRKPEVRDVVVYHEPDGTAHNALVQSVFQRDVDDWLVNLVYVSGDPNRQDMYGRQIERSTSTLSKKGSTVHGNYWRWPDEEPNPYVAPVSQ